MTSRITRAVPICCSLLVLTLVGVFSASSDNEDKRLGRRVLSQSQQAHSKSQMRASRSALKPLSYRSPGRMHKVLIPIGSGEVQARLLSSNGTRRIREFQSYSLFEVASETLAALDAATLEQAQLRDDLNLVLLRGGQIDTTGPNPQLSDELMHKSSSRESLRVVQLSAPPTPDAVRTLKATGARILSYVPNNAYLVWATTAQVNRIQGLRDRSDVIQWESALHPAYKLDPRINLASIEQTRVAIELADVPESAEATSAIKVLSARVLMPEFRAAGGIHTRVLIEANKLPELAKLPEVVAIEPWTEIKLHDERANQIVANVLSEETINSIRVTRPSTPGFSVFLNSHGFNSSFDFAVDIGDTGFDRGAAIAGMSHSDFHDGTGSTRLAYMHDFSSDFAFHPDDATIFPAHDTLGHGTLNASIVGGFNNNSGPAFRDSQGFQYGLGVAPMVRIGVTKLFNDNGSFAGGFSYTDVVSAAYRGGARISTNSWGECNSSTGRCNLYNLDCRAYDSFVRDADPDVHGNQGMVVIFSSGNEGQELPASINMPATAKNVITVGASESFRATDSNGNPLVDGCGAGPTVADNVLDVPSFSSFGPVQDGRSKPDLVAPGTHMVGAATQDPGFTAKSIEDIGTCDYFFPTGQTQYTWSTGTSHAAPVVAGGAALAFQWLRNRFGTDASPAMVKALLLNSTSYLTARNGNDDLPGKHQGWGLLNLARAFESVDRILHDESPQRTFTQSGGTPFEITGVVTDPSREFRVMLVWTDAPGSSTSNAPYVNQLNLEVTVGGVLYQGNQFSGQYSTQGGEVDFLNNAQGVRLPAGVTGPFVIRVKPTIIAGDGVPGNGIDLDQDFALVVTNGREASVPVLAVNEADGLSVGATVTHTDSRVDGALIPDENSLILVAVTNLSPTTQAEITSATLAIPGGPSASTSYPVIPALGSAVGLTPFQIRAPANLRCGAIADFQLRLVTAIGQITLPVRLRVGRESSDSVLLEDDVDSSRVKWKLKKGFSVITGVSTSGNSSYHAVNPGRDEGEDSQLSTMLMKKQVTIPEDAGNVRLTFFHIFNFEPGFDGGVLEVSTDGGATWQDLGSRVLVGGYDGKVTQASDNPLGNRLAWTARGKAGVFSRVVINLDEFAGLKVKLRFQAGFDGATGANEGFAGWFIDDLRITAKRFTCR